MSEETVNENTQEETAPQEAAPAPAPQEASAGEAAAPAPEAKPAPEAAAKKSKKAATAELHTGRRKVSISRVKLIQGSGKVFVNKKPVDVFFSKKGDVNKVLQPLNLLGVEAQFDIHANVKGGGTSGQAEAVRLGISRGLKKLDEAYHRKLREAGFLTRDSRMVERKKYGLHKARRASQFSKR